MCKAENQATKYFLIAHKPFSEDYVLGCLMDSYSGDFAIKGCETEEAIIKEVAELQVINDYFLDRHEAGYEITVIHGDEILFSYEPSSAPLSSGSFSNTTEYAAETLLPKVLEQQTAILAFLTFFGELECPTK